MKKSLICFLALAMLLSLVACGAPAVDDSATKQQIEVNMGKDNKTDKEQLNVNADKSSDKVASGDEKKADEALGTPSGDSASDTNTGSPDGADTGSASNPNTSSTDSNTDASGNTGSSNNSGSSAGSSNTSDAGSSSTVDNGNDSTSGAVSTPVHTHNWTITDTFVACFDCGILDHSHIWEEIYTTEVVDDYEMSQLLSSIAERFRIKTEVEFVEEKFKEYEEFIGDHIEEPTYLKQSQKELQRPINLICGKLMEMALKIYQ